MIVAFMFEFTPNPDIIYKPGLVELGESCAEAVNALMGAELMILRDINNYVESEGGPEAVDSDKLTRFANLQAHGVGDAVRSILNHTYDAMCKLDDNAILHMVLILNGFSQDLMFGMMQTEEGQEFEIPPPVVMSIQAKILNVIGLLAGRYCNDNEIMPGELTGDMKRQWDEMEMFAHLEKEFGKDDSSGS